jgi:hypothetical protein
MRRISVLGAAALLALLPTAIHAQTTPAATSSSQEVIVEKSTTVVVKEAPKPSPVTFTPYGFVLFNAFFNDSPGGRTYPLPTYCVGGASCEGNILFNVAQSRLGSRLSFNDTAGWTGATLSALFEIDFKGGYTGTPTSSVGFYSPVVRLRKAYVDAAWGTQSKFTIRIGQDDHLVSLMRPVSLAYVADPLFQNAGTLNGRAPMLALRYDLSAKDGIGFWASVAALNPQDNAAGGADLSPSAAADLGAGNRSRMPDFEGVVGVNWMSGGKKVLALNGWGGIQKNRFVSPAPDTSVDVTSSIIGGDLTLNLSIFTVMGSIYSAKGYDMVGSLGASQGIAISVAKIPPTATKFTITGTNAVPALGGWFQVLVGPANLFQAYGGWGGTQSPFSAYEGSLLAVPGTRVQNFMWAAGLIGYAGKNWRFSAEYASATSFFYNGLYATQGQFSLNSQLVF